MCKENYVRKTDLIFKVQSMVAIDTVNVVESFTPVTYSLIGKN